MGFLLAVLSFVVAEEVVELEPVKSGNYDCNLLTETDCRVNPYCHWILTNPAKCIDDPCLASGVLSDSAVAGDCTARVVETITVNCQLTTNTSLGTSDCVGGTGKFCSTDQKVSSTVFDYCFWANLRDGSSNCPASICQYADKKCIPRTGTSECQALNSKAECGLVPKCVWRSTSMVTDAGDCMQDPCFVGSEGKSCGGAFVGGGWIESLTSGVPRQSWQKRLDGTDLQPEDCVLFEPYKATGSTTYCVYKDNKTPNKCYFLKSNTTDNTDYGQTYPTYVAGTTQPNCNSVIAACDAHTSGECITKWNPSGALAGQYCGDATHGSNGASILRGSSLAVLLTSALLYLLA